MTFIARYQAELTYVSQRNARAMLQTKAEEWDSEVDTFIKDAEKLKARTEREGAAKEQRDTEKATAKTLAAMGREMAAEKAAEKVAAGAGNGGHAEKLTAKAAAKEERAAGW